MSRAAALLSALLLGLLVGAATVALPAAPPDTAGPVDTAIPEGPVGIDDPAAGSAAAADVPEPDANLLVAWTAGGLPDGFTGRVRALPTVSSVVEVAGDTADLTASTAADGTPADRPAEGWAVPLDVIAADPEAFAAAVSRPADIGTLRPGGAVLGATAARLRDVGVGATLTLAPGVTVRVAVIVDDVTVGGAELLLHPHDADAAGVITPRYLLLHHDGDRAALEAALREAAGTRPLRVRAPGETPYLRHGDAVLPQAQIKAIFGEFTYRPAADARTVEIDPAWVAEHIRTAEVPILGSITCHRAVLPTLETVLEQLADDGLAHLVDHEEYAGCFAARRIAPDQSLSRHTWGAAIDLNQDTNPTGQGSGQDPRLVTRFAAAGFTWGGTWLVPDPMHFEYVQPPTPTPPKGLDH